MIVKMFLPGVMENMRIIRSFEISVLSLLLPYVLLPVCSQAAGPHVERGVTGFNVPRSQH